MCGIIAVYDPQGSGRLDADVLKGRINASLGYIAHRGPDATGVWMNEDVTCGEFTPVYSRTFLCCVPHTDTEKAWVTADSPSTTSRPMGNSRCTRPTGKSMPL